MKININRLTVKYNQRVVGFLEELSNGKIAFQYDQDWLLNGFSISPFHLPLKDQVFIPKSEYFEGLFGVFHDSLPDGWGELLVRRMLAKKNINFDKISVLTRLSLLSANGLGALTYEPSQAESSIDEISDYDRLADEINNIIEYHRDTEDFDLVYQLGGASGGARPKAHLLIDNEEWIVKFPSSLDPKEIGYLEYKANLIALNSGIKVSDFGLIPSNKSKGYFASKRFDRKVGKKIHMISLSSMLETTHRIPNLDYSHLFQVIQHVCVNQEDLYEAYKRMCFNVLYQNKDDHGKNFAFLYDEQVKGYKLSPFYDITKTIGKAEHEMTILGKGNPDKSILLEIAKEFNLSMKECKFIIDNIEKQISTKYQI
jgi:serine/threonine-protein kinase HipA